MKNLVLTLALILVSFCSYAQCTGKVRIFDMADPVDGSPWPLVTNEYVPNYQGAPVIFILPPIVGETQLDRQLALKFCNSGMAAYILHTMRHIDRQRELRAAVREPLVYVMRGSHRVGLVKATRLHGGKITSFFAKRLL
jgi:hypothetical protein